MFIWDWFTGVLGYLGKYKQQNICRMRVVYSFCILLDYTLQNIVGIIYLYLFEDVAHYLYT